VKTACDLTVGIITCGRPAKIAACLSSVYEMIGKDAKVIVVDSCLNDETRKIYAAYAGICLLDFSDPISPAAARCLLAQKVDTSLLLYLDDDIVLADNTVDALLQRLGQSPKTDIVSAAWKEKGGCREIAQTFHQAADEKGEVIFKRFLDRDECLKMGLRNVQADGLHATIMARTEIFKVVSFDPGFGFYLELFDFFMQCKKHGLKCEAVTDTVFWHLPTAYRRETNRQSVPRAQGIEMFVRKWGLRPVGPLGRPPGSGSFLSRLKRLSAQGL
jgi:glycosyltransferase involved in cell wall biosynthesis